MSRGRKERTPAQIAVLAQAREKAKIVIAERAKLGAGATDESESSTTGSTFSPKFVAFGGATQPPRSSERARPSVSLRHTTSKTVSRAHCRVRGTFGRKLNPFSRELRRVIRVRRETPGASPRARQSERPDDLESPLIPRLVMIATKIDFVMMGRGRRAGTSREGTHVVAASARR